MYKVSNLSPLLMFTQFPLSSHLDFHSYIAYITKGVTTISNFACQMYYTDVPWRTPKSLVRLKLGLNYSHNGFVKNLGHAPSSQH
jgi:hypothetical protein